MQKLLPWSDSLNQSALRELFFMALCQVLGYDVFETC